MKKWHVFAGVLLVAGSYYLRTKAQAAKTRGTRIEDEVAADVLSIAGTLIER